jgi:hypothetical protein
MKLFTLKKKIARVEAELAEMRERELILEVSATVPKPLPQREFDEDSLLRATLLFWRHLTREQRTEYSNKGYFYTKGKVTGDRYLISPYRAIRERLTHYRPGWEFYCLIVGGVHMMEPTPFEDQMLAKKILIERDERVFLETANAQSIYPEVRMLEVIHREREMLKVAR